MMDNLGDFRPLGYTWRGNHYLFEDAMTREKCPKCGYEFEGGIRLQPPMPDPPPPNPLPLVPPPEEHPLEAP